ncbi:MAG: protease SohB [Proteobacteria bacterium]|nr:MAG: protease SohB [Pseudomonadota bacterium]
MRYHLGTRFITSRLLRTGADPADARPGLSRDLKLAGKLRKRRKKAAVVRFDGRPNRGDHLTLARLIDEIQLNRDKIAEVVVVIESPGGAVTTYGHAYAQMVRIRELGLKLTVCVDTVAASGGYLAALPAQRIIAAPFAVVGSIGVVAFVPNIRKMLEKIGITPRVFTSGKHKRLVHLTDEDSPEERAHFQQKLVSIHGQFLGALKRHRPQARFEEVCEADHWTAAESVSAGLGLVDEIGTSSAYLLRLNSKRDIVHISSRVSPFQSFGEQAAECLIAHLDKWIAARMLGS